MPILKEKENKLQPKVRDTRETSPNWCLWSCFVSFSERWKNSMRCFAVATPGIIGKFLKIFWQVVFPEMFCKKDVPINNAKLIGKHLPLGLFSDKISDQEHLFWRSSAIGCFQNKLILKIYKELHLNLWNVLVLTRITD